MRAGLWGIEGPSAENASPFSGPLTIAFRLFSFAKLVYDNAHDDSKISRDNNPRLDVT